jgi:hypothetical protein
MRPSMASNAHEFHETGASPNLTGRVRWRTSSAAMQQLKPWKT